ncbi:MAG: DNA adenine methylase [Chloroflexi bacterium]|nr:DNA adenine methylase [Chloroflexota bacterium]
MGASKARPFLKWAGGKTQLLPQLRALYPPELHAGELTKYVEPFLGGGAVFFDVAQTFPIREALLCDVNVEVVLIYTVVQRRVDALIEHLEHYARRYARLNEEQRKAYYYQVRAALNRQRKQIDYRRLSDAWIERAAMLLFLNRTCYNGLFRLNRRGDFNTPFGRYGNPRILDAENLQRASRVLQVAEIRQGDFECSLDAIDVHTFAYFDPPYRPISKTSNFTSYAEGGFDDREQTRLARYFAQLHAQTGARLMLSNSDPANTNPNDAFFDDLYRPFKIHRVVAQRAINSKTSKRGAIRELVITNYDPKPN